MQMSYEQLKEKLFGDLDIGSAVNAAIAPLLKSMEEKIEDGKIPAPQNWEDAKADILASTLVKDIGGGFSRTHGGSVVNLASKQIPFISLGKGMAEWVQNVRKMADDPGLRKRLISGREKALVEGQDQAGGYLVPDEFAAVMVQYQEEGTIIWPRATIWPMMRQTLSLPKLAQAATTGGDHFAGVAFTWGAEATDKSESEPEFESLELMAKKLSGYTESSDELLEDNDVNLANFLVNLFGRAWYYTTDSQFLSGTGVARPLGIIQDPAVTVVSRITANRVRRADLLAMDNNLPEMFDGGAVWMARKAVLNELRRELDSNGRPLLQEDYKDFGQGQVGTMLGYPVVRTDKTPALGSKGDIVLGNWSHYYIGDRRRVAIESSTEYQFRKDVVAWRVHGRVDGQAAIPEAFIVLDSTTS